MPLKKISFDWSATTNTQREQTSTIEYLSEEIDALKQAKEKGYDTPYASLNVVDDNDYLKKALDLAKKYDSIKTIIVVGIGGSNLGAMAVQQAIQGTRSNETSDKKIYWADTTDPLSLQEIIHVTKDDAVLLNVISKSGTTTETIANFEVLRQALPKAQIVVTTDGGSKLFEYAYDKKYDILPIPQKVGGRYSVFSTVGLFPLALLNINVRELIKGAKDMQEQCVKQGLVNPAARSAAIHYLHYKRGRTIANTFLFSKQLEVVGKWYRQLMAESLGKEHNLRGSVINSGFTPVVSIGSTDLHSMAQLYLGGPDDTITTFVSVNKTNNLKTPNNKEMNKLVDNISGKKLSEITDAILGGVLRAYKSKQRPLIHVTLEQHDEYSIGQFIQYKMIEVILLANLLGVNPFDQPAVEEYKKETKRLLSQ